MKKQIKSEKRQTKNESRQKCVEFISSRLSKNSINESEVPDLGPELALDFFGKIYPGDPEEGVIPGASPMSKEQKRKIYYRILRDMLKKNGYDPDIADKWYMKWFGKTYA